MIRLMKQENIRSAQKDLTDTAPVRRRLLKLRIYTQRKEARDDSDNRMDGNNRKKTFSKPQIKTTKVQIKSKTLRSANYTLMWQPWSFLLAQPMLTTLVNYFFFVNLLCLFKDGILLCQ